ncbi:50S ribosome-binding GTPase [Candidatus Woesearchaeota archaeon]|nr:50S ribosome-binding GTPase [Candidatus Woesearchaeota archaeon]
MSFQDIPKIEEVDFYLGVAFRSAKAKAELERVKKRKDRLIKSKLVEEVKIQAISSSLQKQLNNIVDKFPRINELDEFYQELFKAMVDLGSIKKSLAAVKWCSGAVDKISNEYISKIRKCQELQRVNAIRREYYGRVSSFLKQIKKNLSFIEETRKIVKDFPVIKTSLFTVAIAGFPNVGKTTLLSKLTKSKPEIKSYPFTTKGINVGYVEGRYEKIQVLDTPGTLNRFDKMNNIERIAYLALKYLAKKIIYVFDLTEPYPLDMQEKLFKKLKELKKPVLVYLSKSDIVDVTKFKHKGLSLDELKKEIVS